MCAWSGEGEAKRVDEALFLDLIADVSDHELQQSARANLGKRRQSPATSEKEHRCGGLVCTSTQAMSV